MEHDHRNLEGVAKQEGLTGVEFCEKYKKCGFSGLDNGTKYNSIVGYTNGGKTTTVKLYL